MDTLRWDAPSWFCKVMHSQVSEAGGVFTVSQEGRSRFLKTSVSGAFY